MKTLICLPLTIFYLLLFSFSSVAQSVGINITGAAPDNSALLDLNSTDKGFLITRVDTVNITSPAFGLMTLAPKDSCMYLYNGDYWVGMGGGGSDCSCNCGTISSICEALITDARDGQTYGAVKIGKQCWTSENLNYTPSSGNFWCYNNDPAMCDTYGRLYDWNAAMDNATGSSANPSGVQGICPEGWHLPSDAEWKELEMELGMTQVDADDTGWRGTNEGEQLKTLTWGGSNSSGFSALPGGERRFTGSFITVGTFGNWWSATSDVLGAWRRSINDSRNDINRGTSLGSYGNSIRCVKN